MSNMIIKEANFLSLAAGFSTLSLNKGVIDGQSNPCRTRG